MKIIWVVESGGLCGGVRVIFEYAVRLKARGHDVIIATLDTTPNWFDLGDVKWWRFQDYNLMDKELKKHQGKKIATWWKTAPLVKNVSYQGEGYYLVADIETSYYWRPFEKEQVLQTYQYGLKPFTHSPYVMKMIPDSAWVGLAIDAKTYKPLPYAYPSKKRAISIVRRQTLKGYSQLGEFARYLGRLDNECELVTFGQDQVVNLGGAWHGDHRVGMTDKQIVQLYSEGSLYCCTSQHEGFGLPMLEAMACGCPVLTTACDGNTFCVDGENSLVLNKWDMKGMAEGAIRIFSDEQLRKKMIKNGIETAREFSDWGKVIDRLEMALG